MNDDVKAFIKDFNSTIREAEVFRYITRCSELQREATTSLGELRARVRRLKVDAIGERNEELANLLLGYECVVDVLVAEIEMWILLKREDPDGAWNKLVTAQMLSVAAVRAHPGFSHLVQHHQRLEAIEKLVFPSQVFVSSGMVMKHQECSICGEEYEDCEHLIGMPYMGEFCNVIPRDIELDHVAIVEHPADKGCRMTEADVKGGIRNRMTWRVEPKDVADETRVVGGFRARATLLRVTSEE